MGAVIPRHDDRLEKSKDLVVDSKTYIRTVWSSWPCGFLALCSPQGRNRLGCDVVQPRREKRGSSVSLQMGIFGIWEVSLVIRLIRVTCHKMYSSNRYAPRRRIWEFGREPNFNSITREFIRSDTLFFFFNLLIVVRANFDVFSMEPRFWVYGFSKPIISRSNRCLVTIVLNTKSL